MVSKKILTSKQDIMNYVGNVSDHLFRKYVELGMPARYEDNRWVAHADNIEDWFKRYTRVSMRKTSQFQKGLSGLDPTEG